jgi:ferric-dicitrate binding protein FerR (iron transport regulator)
MERVDDDKWLDEALNGVLHSDDTQPDFQKWMAHHPEAVAALTAQTPPAQHPPATKTIRMNAWFVKLAAAAVIVIAGIVGITQMTDDNDLRFTAVRPATTLTGPMTHTLKDGSVVKLGKDARIRTYDNATERGFEHLAGTIDVTVVKGKGEFIVTTPYGDVKALGTEFILELVDGTADSGEKVELLSVEVTEGKVEVSNAQGKTTLEASQDTIVEKDAAPYDFNQDEALPNRLKERIQAMLDAFAAGDAAA